MRFTKGLKKFLSLALTSALVITGANVPGGTKQAKAADAVDKITFQTLFSVDKTVDLTGDGDITIEDTGSVDSVVNLGFMQNNVTKTTGVKAALKSFAINGTTLTDIKGRTTLDPNDGKENGLFNGWGLSEAGLAVGDSVAVSADGTVKLVITDKDQWGGKLMEYQVNGTAEKITSVSYTFTISGLSGAAPAPSADASAAPSAEASAEPSAAPAEENNGYTAFLMDAGANVWSIDDAKKNGGALADVEVKEGEATYSVSAKNTSGEEVESDAVICVDIPEFATAINSAGLEPTVKDLKVSLDGVDTEVDAQYLYTGDIEDKGTFRIQIHNQWGVNTGGEAIKAIADETFSFKDEIKVTFTLVLAKGADETCTAFLMDDKATNAKGETGVWSANDAAEGTTAQIALKLPVIKPDGNPITSMYEVSSVNAGDEAVSPDVFNVDMMELITKAAAKGMTPKVSDVHLYLDDVELKLDASKLQMGDLEENGNFRIELYNIYGKAKDDPALDKTKLSYKDEARVTFKVVMEEGTAPTPTTEPSTAPANSYNVYLGYQTNTYAFRDAWDNDTYGLNSKELDYKSEVGSWKDGDLVKTKVDIQDAKIDHNGTYTVSISGMDLTAADSETYNMIFLSTDVPIGMKDLKFTDVSLSVDGGTPVTYAKELPIKPDSSKKYYFYLLINDANYGEAAAEHKTADVGMAKKSISVTFTVSGGDFGGTYKTETIGTKKGKTFTSGNFKYKVTKAATQTTAGTKVTTTTGKVALAGLSAKGKKAKSLTLPATVKSGKAKYTVATLNASAFKGAKATKITLNKNIKKLPKNAFANCKKLSKITFKAKLSSVNKAAFKGCKKTIKVAGTSAKANLKKLKKTSYKKFK